MSKVKILHCVHSVNPSGGGATSFIRQFAEVQDQFEMTNEAVTLDAPAASYLSDFPMPVHALGPGLLQWGYSPDYVPWLRANYRNYDLTIVHGLWQFSSLGAWLALNPSQGKYVVYPHGMLDPWFNEAYPLKHLKKAIYWPLADYHVLKNARAVIFTAEEERQRAARSFFPHRWRDLVINYGILEYQGDLKAAADSFLETYPQIAGKRVLLFFGRIQEKKGVDLLLRAFGRLLNEYPDVHLVLAGPCQTEYKRKLCSLLPPEIMRQRVVWTGLLQGNSKWGALSSAEATILPSHQENFALSIMESMSCGTPVLISDKVNTCGEIARAYAGLVESDNPEGTERLLRSWLDLPAERRREMSGNARRCFAESFNLRVEMGKLLPVLKDISRS